MAVQIAKSVHVTFNRNIYIFFFYWLNIHGKIFDNCILSGREFLPTASSVTKSCGVLIKTPSRYADHLGSMCLGWSLEQGLTLRPCLVGYTHIFEPLNFPVSSYKLLKFDNVRLKFVSCLCWLACLKKMLCGIVVSALAWHSLGREIESCPGILRIAFHKTRYEVATVAMRG